MSQQLEESLSAAELYVAAVLAALEAKDADSACASCAAGESFEDGWHVAVAPAAYFCKDGVHVAVAALACSNCGYVRTHSLDVLGVRAPEAERPRLYVPGNGIKH